MRGRGTAGALLGTLLLTGCSGQVTGVASPSPWPAAPYHHAPLNETSVAQPVATGGDVDRVADGLTRAGFFCAQVRANDAGVQVWCRLSAPSPVDAWSVEVTTVDLVAARDGALQYAGVTLPEKLLAPQTPGPPPTYRDRLSGVLGSSLFTLWPEDADAVAAAVADLGHPHQGWDSRDPRHPESRTATTSHAAYRVTELADAGSPSYDHVDEDPALRFEAVTPRLRDASWPSGSEHYATTTVAAAPGLEAGGFDCYGDIEQPCTRPAGNQQIDYSTVGTTQQILTVHFQAGGGVLDPAVGPEPLVAWGFPQGLTFLSDEVRADVEERFEAARRSGESFTGIVAGVVVVLDADRTSTLPDGTYGVHVEATVGTPLVSVPLG